MLAFGVLAMHSFNAFAENYQQVLPTDKGTVKIGISTIPAKLSAGDSAKIQIDFLNGQTSDIQQHIDYTVTVIKNGKSIFGPIPLTHTSEGSVKIPVEFKENGNYKIIVDVQGVLFQPLPSEKATFSVMVGDTSSSSTKISTDSTTKLPEAKSKTTSEKNSNSKINQGKVISDKSSNKVDSKTKKADSKSTKKVTVKQNQKP